MIGRTQHHAPMTDADDVRLVALLARVQYTITMRGAEGAHIADETHAVLSDARLAIHRSMLTYAERVRATGFASQANLRGQALDVLAVMPDRLPYTTGVHFNRQWSHEAVSDLSDVEAAELQTLTARDAEDARRSNYGAW